MRGDTVKCHTMLTKLPHHLVISRHGIYYLRVTHNGKEQRKSLKTRDPAIARAASYALGATIRASTNNNINMSLIDPKILAMAVELRAQAKAKERIEALERQQREDEIFRQLLTQQPHLIQTQPHAAQPTGQQILPAYPITTADAVKKYLDEREGQITGKSHEAYSTNIKKLAHEFNQQELHTITPGDLSAVLKKMEVEGRAIKTILGYARAWSLAWRWWISQGYATNNPVVLPTYGKAVAARLKAERGRVRTPWAGEDIKKIFSVERLDGLERPEDVFMPLLGLYTGARREAIAQLKIGDFAEYKPGCWSVRFDPKFDKTGRERDIPLHPILIGAGLIDYIGDVRSLNLKDTNIFPHLTIVKEARSHYFGKNFSKLRLELGVAVGSDFHALRTTLISVLALNKAPATPRRGFVGHEAEDTIDVHIRHYEKGTYGAEELANEIFPFLDFKRIGFEWTGWKYRQGVGKTQIENIMNMQQRRALRKQRKLAVEKRTKERSTNTSS